MKGEGSLSSQSSKGEMLRRAEDFVEQNQLQETLSKAVQGMKEERFHNSDEEGRRLAESVTASMDSSRTLRQEAHASLQEAHSLSSEANYIRSNAATINQNLNQEFVDWMIRQPYQGKGSVGVDETRRLLSSTDPKHQEMVQHYARDFLSQHKRGFEGSPAKTMGLESLEGAYQRQSRDIQGHYHQESSSSFDRVQGRARDSGFLVSEKGTTRDDRFLQEGDRAERKGGVGTSSEINPSSSLDIREHERKADKGAFSDFDHAEEQPRESEVLLSAKSTPLVGRVFQEEDGVERKGETDVSSSPSLDIHPHSSLDAKESGFLSSAKSAPLVGGFSLEEGKTEKKVKTNTFSPTSSEINPYFSLDSREGERKSDQGVFPGFSSAEIRPRESGILSAAQPISGVDDSPQQKDGAARKPETDASKSVSSRMDTSSFLDPTETQEKVEGLFRDNESTLFSRQKQMEGHKQKMKESVLTGQKRGLIESVSKGPLSHLSELGRKIKEDLKKASDE